MGTSNDSGANKTLKQPKGQQSMTSFVTLETIGTKHFYEGPISGEKHDFRQLPRATAKLQPFKKDEIFGEEPTKCHQMMMSARNILQLEGKLDTVQKWSDTFDKCFDTTFEGYNKPIAKRLRDLAVRLAKSDPYIMFDKSFWSQGMLLKVEGPCAWMAAYQRFGAV